MRENEISELSHGQSFSGAEGGNVRASIVEGARNQPPYFLSQSVMRVLSRVPSSLRGFIVSNYPQITEQFRQNHGRDPESWEFYQELLGQGVVNITENRHSASVRLALVSYEAEHGGADQADVFSRIVNYEVAFLKNKRRFPNTTEILQNLENGQRREARR